MDSLKRFGVTVDNTLLEKFDKIIKKKGYLNRSKAIRDLIRDYLVQEEWKEGKKETVGILSLVYNHHKREISDKLINLQHNFYPFIVSSTHIHLSEKNCLEVIIIKGKPVKIKKISDRLIGTKGIKYGKLLISSTGKNI
jgi:CopG family nickel-responsive transcriptional regulator